MNEKRQNVYKQAEEWFLINKIMLKKKSISINFTSSESRRYIELQGNSWE